MARMGSNSVLEFLNNRCITIYYLFHMRERELESYNFQINFPAFSSEIEAFTPRWSLSPNNRFNPLKSINQKRWILLDFTNGRNSH